MSIERLLSPRSIAVIGASDKAGKLGNTIIRNIVDSGFDGAIFPVNPKGGEIVGIKAFTGLAEIPEIPDLSVIITPAPTVPEIIGQCVEKGIPSAVIISGGFAETGIVGENLQKEILRRASEGGLRLLGPNCQGLNLPHHPLCASWPLITRKGRVAIVSQSGTVGAELMDRLDGDGLGFSAFISLGNRSDLDESDFIRYFDAHEETKAIALYLEGIRDGKRFRETVAAAGKPLIILKAGRTGKGRQAITTHTRSLAGRHEICRGFFRQSGVITAGNIDELYHFSRGAAWLPVPEGRRLLMMTSSGGAGVLAVDRATELGFEISPPDEVSRKILQSFLPAQAIISNPVDFTGDATPEHYRKTLSAMKDHYDYFMVIFGDPLKGAAEALEGFSNILAVSLGGGDELREETAAMAAAGIPAFPTPETSLDCLAAIMKQQEVKKRTDGQ